MQTFVVAVARPGRTIPPATAATVLRGRPPSDFHAAADHCWSDPQGRVLVRAWERPEPALGITTQWHTAADRVTAFSGHCWPRAGGWQEDRPWVEQLAERCSTSAPGACAEELAGVFSVATIDGTGRGWVVSDPLGLDVLYTGETADLRVVASRAGAAAWALAPPGSAPARDPLGAAWLAFAGYLVGDRTGFAGVRTVPQGTFVEVDPEAGATERQWWQAPWEVERGAVPVDELAELVRGDVAAHLRVVERLPAARKEAGLTGGKDTRLVLAVLLLEGLATGMTFRTLGTPEIPDVEIATEIAERFGLRHTCDIDATQVRTTTYDERIRSFVAASSGMLSIWDEKGRVPVDDAVNVTGLCGEILRTHFPRTADVGSRTELAKRFERGFRMGSAGLLRDDVHALLEAEARATLLDESLPGLSAVDLIDVFFLRHRLRRWTGTSEEVDWSNRLYPLYSMTQLRAGFLVGDTLRRAEVLHRRVIAMASPELARWRFAGSGWPEPIWPEQRKRGSTPPPRHRPARASPAAAPASGTSGAGGKGVTARQSFQRHGAASRRAVLRDHLLADPANPAFDVVDRDRTLHALDHLDELALPERLQLFGAVTAVMWLGGQEA